MEWGFVADVSFLGFPPKYGALEIIACLWTLHVWRLNNYDVGLIYFETAVPVDILFCFFPSEYLNLLFSVIFFIYHIFFSSIYFLFLLPLEFFVSSASFQFFYADYSFHFGVITARSILIQSSFSDSLFKLFKEMLVLFLLLFYYRQYFFRFFLFISFLCISFLHFLNRI